MELEGVGNGGLDGGTKGWIGMGGSEKAVGGRCVDAGRGCSMEGAWMEATGFWMEGG